ncbi:unnamed protein product [Arctia plantaginis]|uniref:DMAP1-binding domain-containing protein n=1 Tax=Arctia plantaginis TaxID=874455 RepID=A0A8S0Z3Q1_ARCPL|nr:unnamed protein product [Arctia plantaginis]
MADLSVDISKLPDEIRDKLAELDLELSEGDITQKGYEKKRTRLLTPYIPQQQPQGKFHFLTVTLKRNIAANTDA